MHDTDQLRDWCEELSRILDELNVLHLLEMAVPASRLHRVDRLRFVVHEIERSVE